jgi:TRAP-type C4-dicarboxylate transport system substrate-binding protein
MRTLWDDEARPSRARRSKAGGAQVVDVDKKPASPAAMKPVYDKFLTDPKLQGPGPQATN